VLYDEKKLGITAFKFIEEQKKVEDKETINKNIGFPDCNNNFDRFQFQNAIEIEDSL
jgi:hypothetical protein